jgi:putative transposase
MPRQLRMEYHNAFYHVMNRGKGRQQIFHDERYYKAFLDTIEEAHSRFAAVIHCYCLMGNHYHLLIETPLANLSRIMRHINGVYTQRYNQLKNTDGPLFRGRYKSILVDVDAYLLQLSRYIHRNPIETKQVLVEHTKDWSWSSYPVYIGKAVKPSWLTMGTLEEVYGSKQAYMQYVEKEDPNSISELYCQKKLPSVLGDLEFKESVKERVSLSNKEANRHLLSKLSFDNIVHQSSIIFDISIAEITSKNTGRKRGNLARKLTIYACQRLGGMTLTEIAHHFNLASNGAVSASLARMKKELVDKNKSELYEALQRKLNVIEYT